ncbi:hypothetical protein K449DRAFT_265868 [Hypoxylon sp. EC38]|nr:hypothetical protein K449DRAFT_265868 [Hypoxylon sp. EC38]
MLRLSSTTLSLTMTEVKEFERHLRFKKYLAKDDTLGKLPIRTKQNVTTAEKSTESEYNHTNQPPSNVISKDTSFTDIKESPGLLSCPPRRPPKPVGGSAESGSQDVSFFSPSGTPSSLGMSQPTGWGNLPMTLPPPFSREKRSISDAQTLPAVCLRYSSKHIQS